MKYFYIILFVFCVGQLVADTSRSLPPQQGDWSIAGELALGSSYVWTLGEYHPDWDSGLYCGSGLVSSYYLTDKIEIQSGLRYDQYQSRGLVLHPQPYMLDSELNLTIHNIRIPLYVNREVLNFWDEQIWYLGVGGYLDILDEAKLKMYDRYVTQVIVHSRSALDDMGVIYPGFQIHLGSKSERYRLEMCYWIDARKYSLAESGSAEYRRSGVSLNYSYTFFGNKH